jgi:hypothetical protein
LTYNTYLHPGSPLNHVWKLIPSLLWKNPFTSD